eukprot:symbB.v1.2.033460.t1/scaffold4159.1/size43755/6
MALAPPEAAASGSFSSSGTLGKNKGECVKVVVRVRPLSSQEITDGREVIVSCWSMASLCVRGPWQAQSWALQPVVEVSRPAMLDAVKAPAVASCCGAAFGALTAWGRRPSRSASTQTSREAEAVPQSPEDPLAVFVVLRKDLDWPTGALINQACHACTAMAWEARDDDQAVAYLSQGVEGTMVKSTMGAKSQAELEDVTKRLTEDVPVCIATWPRPRSVLRKVLKKLSRF